MKKIQFKIIKFCVTLGFISIGSYLSLGAQNARNIAEDMQKGWIPVYINNDSGDGDITFESSNLRKISVNDDLEEMSDGYLYSGFYLFGRNKIGTINANRGQSELYFADANSTSDSKDLYYKEGVSEYTLYNADNDQYYKLTIFMSRDPMLDPSFNNKGITFLPNNEDHDVIRIDFHIEPIAYPYVAPAYNVINYDYDYLYQPVYYYQSTWPRYYYSRPYYYGHGIRSYDHWRRSDHHRKSWDHRSDRRHHQGSWRGTRSRASNVTIGNTSAATVGAGSTQVQSAPQPVQTPAPVQAPVQTLKKRVESSGKY